MLSIGASHGPMFVPARWMPILLEVEARLCKVQHTVPHECFTGELAAGRASHLDDGQAISEDGFVR